jgi:TonB family protein
MYSNALPTIRGSKSTTILLLGVLTFAGLVYSAAAQAPPAQLTLADIIVALRSKKVSLGERNKILTDAVQERGITFALTPEIEKELSATGADKSLVGAIRSKSLIVKASVTNPSNEPARTPEYLVHQQQGDASFARGDIDAAVVEYGKAIELKPELASAYFSRGRIYLNKGWYDNAINDFTKVIELDPKDATALANRGQTWEKKNDVPKAKADYEKAVGINPDNAIAKTNLERIRAEEAKLQPKPAPDKPAQQAQANSVPDSAQTANNVSQAPAAGSGDVSPENASNAAPALDLIDRGSLSPENAVRMVRPQYPPLALKANITGKVTVKVMIDEEGNVTSAKASTGHRLLVQTSEDAARRSKFKPAIYQGKPIRSTGVITYSYSPAVFSKN